MIPKIIHQTFRDATFPPEIQKSVHMLKAMHVDWEYRFYDELDRFLFIRNHYDARTLKAYNSINPMYGAARADFFRYLVVYQCGGVYLDLKSSTKISLNRVCGKFPYLLSHWDNGPRGTNKGWGLHFEDYPNGEFQQWYVASEAKHPFLKAVIDAVITNIENYDMERDGVGQNGVIRLTGPIVYTKAIQPILGEHPHRLARTNHELGLIYNVFQGFKHINAMYNSRIPHYTRLTDPVVL